MRSNNANDCKLLTLLLLFLRVAVLRLLLLLRFITLLIDRPCGRTRYAIAICLKFIDSRHLTVRLTFGECAFIVAASCKWLFMEWRKVTQLIMTSITFFAFTFLALLLDGSRLDARSFAFLQRQRSWSCVWLCVAFAPSTFRVTARVCQEMEEIYE